MRANVVKRPIVAALGAFMLITPITSARPQRQAVLDEHGVYHFPEFALPPSPLSSDEYRQKLIENGRAATIARGAGAPLPVDLSTPEALLRVRARVDSRSRTVAEGMRRIFPVTVTREVIGGVQTDVVML
jgi:hypothetical protein